MNKSALKSYQHRCFAGGRFGSFCRIHKTLRVTPAMEAGLTKDIMKIEDIVKLTDNSNCSTA